MPAVAYNDTAVVEKPWDGPGNEANLKSPVTGTTGKAAYTWYDAQAADPDGDGFPDAKSAWKLPHHEVASNGTPGAANAAGCRAALGRLSQTSGIPAADFGAIRNHLNKHLDKVRGQKSGDDLAMQIALVVEAGSHIWAVKQEILTVLPDLHGVVASDAMISELQAVRSAGRVGPPVANGVAVIPLQGMLMPQVSLMSLLFGDGGTGLVSFRSQLRAAAADPETKSIVLNIDSPGGYVDLIPEIAADIRAAGEQKPVVAVANTMAASAAYWLASQAHEVIASPSAEVGSIGVYQVHMDQSKAMELKGVKPTLVRAGKYKVEGNPYSELSDAARAQMQEGVDDYYNMFTADVAAGRGVNQEDVQNGYGEGRTLTANRAKRAGLVDRVATLDETVARLASGRARVRRAADGSEFELPTAAAASSEQEPGAQLLSAEERGSLLALVAGLSR